MTVRLERDPESVVEDVVKRAWTEPSLGEEADHRGCLMLPHVQLLEGDLDQDFVHLIEHAYSSTQHFEFIALDVDLEQTWSSEMLLGDRIVETCHRDGHGLLQGSFRKHPHLVRPYLAERRRIFASRHEERGNASSFTNRKRNNRNAPALLARDVGEHLDARWQRLEREDIRRRESLEGEERELPAIRTHIDHGSERLTPAHVVVFNCRSDAAPEPGTEPSGAD